MTLKLQDLSLENRFLIDCLNASLEKTRPDIKCSIFTGLNWEAILLKSISLSIAPLISYTVQNVYTDLPIPVPFKNSLYYIYQKTLKRNLFIYHIVYKIIKSFQTKDLPFLFLRGPVLCENLYNNNIALRPMTDLDILIKEKDYLKADKLLRKLDYHLFGLYHPLQKIYMNINSKISLNIELHFDVDPKLENNPEEIWENTCVTKIGNSEVLMLRPESLLEHLLTHLDKHIKEGTTRLIWLADIQRLIKYYNRNMNWNYFIDKIEKNNLQNSIYGLLSIIEDWLEIDLSEFVKDRLKTVPYLYSQKDIFDPCPTKQVPYAASLPKIQGVFNKICFILRLLFPHRQIMVQYYSKDKKSFSYFFYFYRLYKMLIVIFNIILRKLKYSLKH